MDKIWYRNPSKLEVIGRCGGMKKPNDHAEPTKVERLKKNNVCPFQYWIALYIIDYSSNVCFQAMWLMLQEEKPEDFVISMNEAHSVKEFVEAAFKKVDIDIV